MRRPFFLLLTAIFLVGCLGHLLLRQHPPEEVPCTLTFEAENVSGFLQFSLPEAGAHVTLLDTPAEVWEVTWEPSVLYSRQGERLCTRPGILCAHLTVRVRANASVREGELSLGEKRLFLGDTVTLSGDHFAVSAHFTGFSVDF